MALNVRRHRKPSLGDVLWGGLTGIADVIKTLAIGYGLILRQARKSATPWAFKYLMGRAVRFLKFGGVGLTVFAIGYGIQAVAFKVLHLSGTAIVIQGDWLLTGSLPLLLLGASLPFDIPLKWETIVFLLEGMTSVELVFFGSRYITWRDRKSVGFWRSWWMFHAARGFTFFLNQFLLNWQVLVIGLDFGLAKVAALIVGSAFNYVASDLYAFAPGVKRDPSQHQTIVMNYPKVSVVAPVKGSGDTIKDFVRSVFDQGYFLTFPRNVDLILVGDLNDPTWKELYDLDLTGLPVARLDQLPIEIIELLVLPPPDRPDARDTNMKRREGELHASGAILVYLDPDGRPVHHWLGNVVIKLTTEGYDYIGGPLAGLDGGAWTQFIDSTTTGSKTGRAQDTVQITPGNIGEYKFPVTANVAMWRKVMDRIGAFAIRFTHSFEDYVGGQAALDAGFKLGLSPDLLLHRKHREGFWALFREYLRSGMGLWDFVRTYPDSGFTISRMLQLIAAPIALLAAVAGGVFFRTETIVLGCASVLSLMLANVLASKSAVGAVYPFIGGIFSLAHIYGVCQAARRYGFNDIQPPRIAEKRVLRFTPNGLDVISHDVLIPAAER